MSAANSDPDPLGLKKLQKELNSGAVAIVLLATIRHSKAPMYGYEIAKKLEAAGGPLPMNVGALYPVLRSLESAKLLVSHVEPATSGPPRRYYTITSAGISAYAAWRDVWHRTKHFVETSLETSDEHKSEHRQSRTRSRKGGRKISGRT